VTAPNAAHLLDLESLARFLDGEVAGYRGGPLRAQLIHGGRSNLTYLLDSGADQWVLRRPPLGAIAPSANDLGREFRIMRALADTAVPVPGTIVHCTDSRVLGAPFSLVAKVDGDVIRSRADAEALSVDQAAGCTRALISVLADLHALRYEEIGLGQFGRPAGFLARQVDRWRKQWAYVSTEEVPAVDELHRRLSRVAPVESDHSVVHGDYRLDNTILASGDPTTIAAVVDWEMATLGDPLADVGMLLVYWDPVCEPLLPDGNPVLANPGFPPAVDVAGLYASASGRDLDNLPFYIGLGYFKLAVIARGIHQRYLDGDTVGEGFETIGRSIGALLDAGLDVTA